MSDDPAAPEEPLPADTPWWARLLIEDFRSAWRFASVWWPAACASAAEVYAQDPQSVNEFVQAHVPAGWWPHIVAAAFVVSAAVRVIRQSKLKPKGIP